MSDWLSPNPPDIAEPLSSITKKKQLPIESNKQLTKEYFDTLLMKYGMERKILLSEK